MEMEMERRRNGDDDDERKSLFDLLLLLMPFSFRLVSVGGGFGDLGDLADGNCSTLITKGETTKLLESLKLFHTNRTIELDDSLDDIALDNKDRGFLCWLFRLLIKVTKKFSDHNLFV